MNVIVNVSASVNSSVSEIVWSFPVKDEGSIKIKLWKNQMDFLWFWIPNELPTILSSEKNSTIRDPEWILQDFVF